ncbi:MAG: C39 family peptidase [Patescibacteria group bacterium]|nr:C39 family peptidase [Patescibacteria group bacterium]
MKKILLLLILALLLCPGIVQARTILPEVRGRILLQVEANGEAWYLSPSDNQLYYLGRPADAFAIMKKLALGVKHSLIIDNTIFPDRLSGRILLDVERNGEAYYIHPHNKHKYFLGRPADAFRIMRELGLGISNDNLSKLKEEISNTSIINTDNKQEIFISGVPFTSQAPFADWSDSRQQNGCEEASTIMAMSWAKGGTLNKTEALSQIIALSDWLKSNYGIYIDTSTQDTMDWIIKDYFNYHKVERFANASKEKIIESLTQGKIVLAAFDGRELNNPNFVAPGPTTHMLVILGYNPTTDVFITNDPGTRNGENYRYNTDVLFQAIRDYPTGNHKEIISIEKNIIVVSK